MDLDPQMTLTELKSLIETHYDWALEIDFSKPETKQTFWYRSEEKMEPRLGDCSLEPGADKQMPLGIGYLVRQCYDQLQTFADNEQATCADFLLQQPQSRGIVRRIQAMSQTLFGEIRANLLDKDVLPMHLLRAKLAFFGVSVSLIPVLSCGCGTPCSRVRRCWKTSVSRLPMTGSCR